MQKLINNVNINYELEFIFKVKSINYSNFPLWIIEQDIPREDRIRATV